MTSEKKPSAPTPGVNPTTFVEPIFQQLMATGMAMIVVALLSCLQYLRR